MKYEKLIGMGFGLIGVFTVIGLIEFVKAVINFFRR